MKPTQSHLNEAQRIYDRLGRGSVADIDAIAQALAEAERGGKRLAVDEIDALVTRRRKQHPKRISTNAHIAACAAYLRGWLSEAES